MNRLRFDSLFASCIITDRDLALFFNFPMMLLRAKGANPFALMLHKMVQNQMQVQEDQRAATAWNGFPAASVSQVPDSNLSCSINLSQAISLNQSLSINLSINLSQYLSIDLSQSIPQSRHMY